MPKQQRRLQEGGRTEKWPAPVLQALFLLLAARRVPAPAFTRTSAVFFGGTRGVVSARPNAIVFFFENRQGAVRGRRFNVASGRPGSERVTFRAQKK